MLLSVVTAAYSVDDWNNVHQVLTYLIIVIGIVFFCFGVLWLLHRLQPSSIQKRYFYTEIRDIIFNQSVEDKNVISEKLEPVEKKQITTSNKTAGKRGRRR